MQIAFPRAADYLTDESSAHQIAYDLDQYFSSYIGRYFECFVARSFPGSFHRGGPVCRGFAFRAFYWPCLADRLFRLSPTVPNDVTLLRRIDVALWMAGSRATPQAHRSAAPDSSLQADNYNS